VLLGGDGTPKVTDFGLVKKLDVIAPGHRTAARLTASGAVLGTPSYMAPEQAGGQSKEIGPACDIYALGAILYECLIGRPPFHAATPFDTIQQVVADDPVPPRQFNSRIPVDLETICLKCLMKDPRRRYPTSQELAEDLRRYQEGRPIRARRVGPIERAVKWVKRRPAAAAALVGGVLFVFGTGAFSMKAGETAARDELDRFRAQVASEREQQHQQQLLEEDARARERQLAEARRRASRQLAKVAVLWDDYPREALRLLEDGNAFPPELHDSAWEGYHRLCTLDRQALQGDGPRITRLKATADFKTLLIQDADDTVRLCGWNGNSLQQRYTLRLPAVKDELVPGIPNLLPAAQRPMRVRSVSVSADANLLSYSKRMTLFMLNSNEIDSLGAIHGPDDAFRKLDGLRDKPFDSQEELSNELTKVLDKGEVQRVRETLLKVAKKDLNVVVVHDVRSNEIRALTSREMLCLAESVLSPAGNRVAGESVPGSVLLCDVASGNEARWIGGSGSHLETIAFSPDGKTLAVRFWVGRFGSGPHAYSVQLWDVATGRRHAELAAQIVNAPTRLAFSPDGKCVAARCDVFPGGTGQPPELLAWDVPPPEQTEPAP
jgi:hypothetical protein